VTWEHFVPEWSAADVDVAAVWAACGGQWLTDPAVGVPVDLVNGVVGLTTWLDGSGAGLADLFGGFGAGVLTEHAAAQQLRSGGRISCGGASRLVRCVDGWIAVSLARLEDFASIPAWLETEQTSDTWSTVERTLSSMTVASTVERAQLLGLACAGVGELRAQAPGVHVEALGTAPPTQLDGLVVADLASLWAGPLAADVLAGCGARVISIESTSRPDGARAWPAFFNDLHGRCESVSLDFTDDGDRRRLAKLLQRVDVVIEGSRPRVLEQLGIDARAVTCNGPRIWVSITGHGRAQPNAHRIGFGDDAAAAGGLVGWVEGEPRFVADAVADPLTGLTVAATVIQLAAAGGRWLVDAPLAGIAAAHVGEPTVVAQRDSTQPMRRRIRGAPLPLGRDTERVLAEFGDANS